LPSVFKALQQHPGPYEIIIVDDCSTDNSRQVMEELAATHPEVRVLYNEANKGFSGTCNAGIAIAQYDILFFFNNDVELEPDYFQYYSAHFNDPDLFALTTCGYTYSERQPLDGIKTWEWKRGLPRVTGNIFNEQIAKSTVKPPYYSFGVQGAYFFADRKKIDQLNGFDEIYAPYNYEETDLGYRAMKRGWKIYYEPRCVGYHLVSATINKTSSNFTKQVISNRNRMIFVWKNIHDKTYLTQHVFFILLKLLSFNRVYLQGVRQLLDRWPEVKTRRKAEKQAAILSDRELIRSYTLYQSTVKNTKE
jgi:GT2 family glycosyltransferase